MKRRGRYGQSLKNPVAPYSERTVREMYKRAVDPDLAPAKVTRLKDMSPEKLAELEKQYGAPIKPLPPKPKAAFERLPPFPDRGVTCPACKNSMRPVKGPYGLFYGCTTYPKCKTTWKSNANGEVQGLPRIPT